MIPNTTPRPRRQIVYTSWLAPGHGAEVIRSILQTSRAHNPKAGLGGALLFDGARFVQWLEGDPSPLGALMQKILADPRHIGIRWIHDMTGDLQRRAGSWVAGYIEPEHVDEFESSVIVGGRDAVAEFIGLLAAGDVI